MSLIRRRLLDDTIKKTASGNPIAVQSVARMRPGIKIFGRSTQDGTPSPDHPVPIVSAGEEVEINVSVSDAGINLLFNTGENKDYNTIHRNWGYNIQNLAKVIVTGNQAHYTVPETGTNINNNTGFGCDFARLYDTSANDIIFKRGQKYVWSCDAKGISSPNQSLSMKVFYTNTSGSEWVSTGKKRVQLTEDWERYSCEFTVPDDFDEEVNRIALNFPIGTDTTAYLDIKNLKLEKGTVATKWTPNPTDGDPLNYQTLTLSTPGGLPGIPVPSGGNYTDENGQQWICDEVDFKRGKYVQRVKCARLSGDINDTEISLGRYMINVYNIFGVIPRVRYPVITSVARTIEPINSSGQGQIFQYSSGVYWYCTDYFSTKEELETYLNENDVTIIGHLSEPIETDLTAEEIAAYKALHTYSPTTTMMNNEKAGMKLTYKTRKGLEAGA